LEQIQTTDEEPIENFESLTREQQMLQDILIKIGVGEQHWHKFFREEIGIYDFFLLKREDLIELSLPIAVRNRILAFQEHYRTTMQHDAEGTVTIESLVHETLRTDKYQTETRTLETAEVVQEAS
jgi:hypothetical protein